MYERLEEPAARLEAGLRAPPRTAGLRPAGGGDGDALLPRRARAKLRGRERRATRTATRRSSATSWPRGAMCAVAVRGDVRLDRARRGRDRGDGGGARMTSPRLTSASGRRSRTRRAARARSGRPRFGPTESATSARLLDARPRPLRARAESIYEGYLLHYGRPRLFAPADSDTAILLGDYLYAHGLVRVASHGEVGVGGPRRARLAVRAARAEERDDGAAWAGTVSLLGNGRPAPRDRRAALRRRGSRPSPRPRGARGPTPKRSGRRSPSTPPASSKISAMLTALVLAAEKSTAEEVATSSSRCSWSA